MGRISRRQLAILLAISPLAAQTPPPPAVAGASQGSPETLAQAVDDVRQSSERLQKMVIPMDVEPAFSFKA